MTAGGGTGTVATAAGLDRGARPVYPVAAMWSPLRVLLLTLALSIGLHAVDGGQEVHVDADGPGVAAEVASHAPVHAPALPTEGSAAPLAAVRAVLRAASAAPAPSFLPEPLTPPPIA